MEHWGFLLPCPQCVVRNSSAVPSLLSDISYTFQKLPGYLFRLYLCDIMTLPSFCLLKHALRDSLSDVVFTIKENKRGVVTEGEVTGSCIWSREWCWPGPPAGALPLTPWQPSLRLSAALRDQRRQVCVPSLSDTDTGTPLTVIKAGRNHDMSTRNPWSSLDRRVS